MWIESLDLDVISGETWMPRFQAYQDETQASVQDLTGLTLTLIVELPLATQSTQIALSNPTSGLATATVQTAGWTPGLGRWLVKTVDAEGDVTYSAQGALFVAMGEMLPT